MSSYASSSVNNPNMPSYSVEYLSTPSRYNHGGAGKDPDTDSSSPGNNTSDGSPNLLLALSGEDAVESPPLKARSMPPPRRPLVSSPSDLEEDATHVNGSPSTSTSTSISQEKPSQSYIALISQAILQHPQKKMILGDIYQYIMDTFPHYRNSADKAWRNSIRHNLSINECFIKAGRADNGKGNYWAIHPACEVDFGKGDFRRRQARRRARRSQQMNVSKMPLTYRYSLGYVPMKSISASAAPAPAAAAAAAAVGPMAARGAYGGARAHPYGTTAHHQHQHQHHQQLQSGAYGRMETSPNSYHHPQHHMAAGVSDYTNSQYYSALTNACLSLSQPATSSPTSSSSYTSTPTSRMAASHSYPGTSSSTSPTLLPGSYLQPSSLSPVSPHESSSNLLELGSSFHPSNTTMQLQHQQQHNINQHYPSPPQGLALSPYSTSACVYQGQGVSPPGYGSSSSSTTTTPITISPPGALYGGPYSGLPLCFQDMPALRDAINGMTGLSS